MSEALGRVAAGLFMTAGREGHLPPRQVSLLPGGQNPISLEYQIHLTTIDTLVTGMPHDRYRHLNDIQIAVLNCFIAIDTL